MASWLRFCHFDWSQTQAYSEETPYFPTIWVNVLGREPAGIVGNGKEYEDVREQIVQQLCSWLDPETGQRVVKNVHKREEIYSGGSVERSPDLIVEWNLDKGYSYLFKNSRSGKGRDKPISQIDEKEKQQSKSGDHREHGIFVASGKNIEFSRQLSGAEIIDLAPTILYLLGLPIPSDMDGKVLTQIFRNDYLTSHPVHYDNGSRPDADLTQALTPFSPEEEEAVRERLKGLGYIE